MIISIVDKSIQISVLVLNKHEEQDSNRIIVRIIIYNYRRNRVYPMDKQKPMNSIYHLQVLNLQVTLP
jgi:hypothetical protein